MVGLRPVGSAEPPGPASSGVDDLLPACGLPPGAFPREYFNRALGRGRLSHAYLFLGPSGSGRRRLALEVAKAVFCQRPVPCSDCPSCRSIEHGNHPSVHRYGGAEKGGTVEIDEVRDLSGRIHLRRSEFLVAIIENADRMTLPAANALLKTLEEPTGVALLILIAQSSGVLLPTIVSRCHRIPFPAPPASAASAGPPSRALEEMALPGFVTEKDPREWLTSAVPAAENLREAVRGLLDALLAVERGRWSPPGASGSLFSAHDPGAERIEEILELLEDLDRNVNPDLVLEAALLLGRSAA